MVFHSLQRPVGLIPFWAFVPSNLVSIPILLLFNLIMWILGLLHILPHALPSATHDMRNKVVIVTGCNTGIGKQTAIGLATLGATVIMACRNKTKAKQSRDELVQQLKKNQRKNLFASNGRLEIEIVDLGCFVSVGNFCERMNSKYHARGIDAVVCNAGVNGVGTSSEGLNMNFQVNFLSQFALVLLLLPLLRKRHQVTGRRSRVVMLGSLMANWGQTNPFLSATSKTVTSSYCDSKLACTLFVQALSARESESILVCCANPGSVASDILRDTAWVLSALRPVILTTTQGAATSIEGVASEDLDKQNFHLLGTNDEGTKFLYLVPYLLPFGFLVPFEIFGVFAGARVWVHPGFRATHGTILWDKWVNIVQAHSKLDLSRSVRDSN